MMNSIRSLLSIACQDLAVALLKLAHRLYPNFELSAVRGEDRKVWPRKIPKV